MRGGGAVLAAAALGVAERDAVAHAALLLLGNLSLLVSLNVTLLLTPRYYYWKF